MHEGREAAHADFGAHDHGHLIDELAGARGDNRRTENLIRALLHVYFDETGIYAVRDRAIDILHHHCIALHGDGSLSRFARMHTDMRDLRIAVGTPRNCRLMLALPPRTERVLSG